VVTSQRTAPWTADLGDGSYRNPVLFADWSDPDVIRVGDDFYLVASSFNRVPGLPVLHSTDLVNWRLIGHALDRLTPTEFFATPRAGCGVWAPAIRHHAGLFWICYPDPDHGIFVLTAEDPAGPWTEPRLVLPGRGLIDPCPLWDDDGNAYLVLGWARSRAGFNNRLTAYRMAADLSEPLDDGVVIIDGDQIPGCRTLEGPKWYRRDGWYWIFAPAGGVADGWQFAFRSREVFGPYESRIVLAQGDTDVNGPHQGAWISAPDGRDWFVHFQDQRAYGRVVHLQPLHWRADGWPVIGDDDGTGLGSPVARHLKPADGPPAVPPTSDPFPGGVPGPQWTWSANPDPSWLLDAGGTDGLRLACRPAPWGDLRVLPNVLGQRLPAPRLRAETGLRLTAPAGARAGLAVLGSTYGWIGLEHRPAGPVLVCRFAETADRPTPQSPVTERDVLEPVPVPANAHVRLSVVISEGAVARFAADVDGTGWRLMSPPFAATPGGWIGALLALFATGPAGYADVDPFLVNGLEDR
jgi:beta-xylosidase